MENGYGGSKANQSLQNAGSNISNLISEKLGGEKKLKENTGKQSGQAKCKIRKIKWKGEYPSKEWRKHNNASGARATEEPGKCWENFKGVRRTGKRRQQECGGRRMPNVA